MSAAAADVSIFPMRGQERTQSASFWPARRINFPHEGSGVLNAVRGDAQRGESIFPMRGQENNVVGVLVRECQHQFSP